MPDRKTEWKLEKIFRGKENMTHRRVLSAFTALLCSAGMLTVFPHVTEPAVANAAMTIANPFIWSDVPDDDIIRVGDTYYMVHTTMFFAPGAPIMKSKDLFSWEMCNYVYDTYADGAKQTLSNGQHDYAHGQWATSLRYHDGKYYVFFGSYGTNKSYIYQTLRTARGHVPRSTACTMMPPCCSMTTEENIWYTAPVNSISRNSTMI